MQWTSEMSFLRTLWLGALGTQHTKQLSRPRLGPRRMKKPPPRNRCTAGRNAKESPKDRGPDACRPKMKAGHAPSAPSGRRTGQLRVSAGPLGSPGWRPLNTPSPGFSFLLYRAGWVITTLAPGAGEIQQGGWLLQRFQKVSVKSGHCPYELGLGWGHWISKLKAVIYGRGRKRTEVPCSVCPKVWEVRSLLAVPRGSSFLL